MSAHGNTNSTQSTRVCVCEGKPAIGQPTANQIQSCTELSLKGVGGADSKARWCHCNSPEPLTKGRNPEHRHSQHVRDSTLNVFSSTMYVLSQSWWCLISVLQTSFVTGRCLLFPSRQHQHSGNCTALRTAQQMCLVIIYGQNTRNKTANCALRD